MISYQETFNRLDKYDALGNRIIRKTFSPHISEGTNIIVYDNNQFKYLAGRQGYPIYLFDEYFNILPGWPQQGYSGYWITASVGRLTYDNRNLILADGYTDTAGISKVRAFDMLGVEQFWSPLTVDGAPYGGYALNDIDNDGSTELIILTVKYEYDSRISIFKFPGVPFSYENFSWPMYAHDRYKTNQFGFIPPDEPVGIQPITNNIPDKFILYQNYPNPFNPFTQIRFELPDKTNVRLKIYDALGREVQNMVNSELRAGVYQITFQSGALPTGVYYYRIVTDNFSDTKKMLLIK